MDPKDSVSQIPYANRLVKNLDKLGIKTVLDLLLHVPSRYQDYSQISKVVDFPVGETATMRGEIISFRHQYAKSGKKIQIAEVYDGTGSIYVVWFNQPFLSRSLPIGTKLSLSGTLGWWARKKALYTPEYEKINEDGEYVHTARLTPIYPLTAGISSKWIRNRIHFVVKNLKEEDISEFLPKEFLNSQNFYKFYDAIHKIHYPDSLEDAGSARKRLAFNELLLLQIQSQYKKIEWQKNEPSHKIDIDKEKVSKFIANLPFELTDSQKSAVDEILADLGGKNPMNRLLEGDVGSGKTVVSAIAALAVQLNGQKSVVMAPTQILATQHYETFKKFFSPLGVDIALFTSSDKQKTGKNPQIFIGTHSLIHQKIDMDEVALVVIDEQHRFGVEQRSHLIKKTTNKTIAPHVLTMTATPIPRTIALTLYGELDLSVLKEVPKGRLETKTWLVPPEKRDGAYDWIKKEIKNNNAQAFIVCPLIEESIVESMQQVKSAKAEFEKLSKIFTQFRVGLLHGKLKVKEKQEVLDKFRQGSIDILVTTPVVEVGVDIPNATVMMIETAERFGLSALHQLRGRVGRGSKQSYCLLFTDSENEKVIKRLSAMKESTNGFELSEIDLELRGPGEILGVRQHGVSELRIASWTDRDLITLSRQFALKVIDNPKKYLSVWNWAKGKQKSVT